MKISTSSVSSAAWSMKSVRTTPGCCRPAEAKAAELRQRLLDVNAAKSGLQLTGPRTLDAPQQNQRDMSLTIENMQQEKLQLIARKQATTQSIQEVAALLHSRQQAALNSSTDGVIWDVTEESGASVQNGTPIVRILDCRTRWVEAFLMRLTPAVCARGWR